MNVPDEQMPYEGAFHGAEVPFVFGDSFELKGKGEMALSQAMGCYWVNFATTGNPNRGPSSCSEKLGLPEWPLFNNGDAIELDVGSIRNRSSLKAAECDMFAAHHALSLNSSPMSFIV